MALADVTLFGRIELHPDKAVHLHSKYAGVVRGVFKGTGEKVRAGESLARIEINAGIQSYELTSSISGVVLERRVAAGQSISTDVEAFVVADTSVVSAVLTAYSRDLPRLKVGQTVTIRVPSGKGSQKATITFVSPILAGATRTAEVRVDLDNAAGTWRAGRNVLGEVVTDEQNGKATDGKP